jgi:hypothetical protein
MERAEVATMTKSLTVNVAARPEIAEVGSEPEWGFIIHIISKEDAAVSSRRGLSSSKRSKR